MAAIIECKNLSKHYGSVRALDNLDLLITDNSPTGLIGPNGAGKTTLFSVLCGFVIPGSGNALLNGKPPGHSSLMGKLSILPQDTPFTRGISVKSQLELYARLQGMSGTAAKNEVMQKLELVELKDISKQFPETLSFGQRKRITFAQALIGNPEIVFLDEPTSGLDPVAAAQIRNLIMNLRDDKLLMISSHNLEEIQDLCKQVVMINHGRVIEHRNISDLIEQETCITLKLDRALPENVAARLSSDPEIRSNESTAIYAAKQHKCHPVQPGHNIG